jgi:hypothetical protein
MMTRKFSPRALLALAIVLLVAIWASVIGAFILLEPDTTQRALILGAGAVATEILFYIGAGYFGISAFGRIRDKLAMRRSG